MNADWYEYKPDPRDYNTFKLTVTSKKYTHNFTVTETCLRFAKWEAIRRFKEKHPHTTKVVVTER